MDIYVYSGAYHCLGLICVFVIIDDLNVDRCLRYIHVCVDNANAWGREQGICIYLKLTVCPPKFN